MLKLKDILMEDPDGFKVAGVTAEFDNHYAIYTYMVYYDLVDKQKNWVAYDYRNQKVICSNKKVEDEIYNISEEYVKIIADRYNPHLVKDADNPGKFVINVPAKYHIYSKENVESWFRTLKYRPTHSELTYLLGLLRRCEIDRNKLECDGRFYEINNKIYSSFWIPTYKLLEYKKYIDDFMVTVGMDKNNLFIEYYGDDEWKFITYDEVFDEIDDSPKKDAYREKLLAAQKELHVNKAKLDIALLNALQSKPKDVNMLYRKLETEMGMPIAQIRHAFRGIPLDKLISKTIKEILHERKKHDKT